MVRTAVHRVQLLHGLCLWIPSMQPLTSLRTHQLSLHPGCDMVTACYSFRKKGNNTRVRDRCLPVFFRCMMMGCSRFPRSCSGTPATSVCYSSPGLGSFLRPRSAASWAPRIGRRIETGTYFSKTSTRRNDPKQLETRF